MVKMLNLSHLSGEGDTSVLSGKQRGLAARAEYNLDALDEADEELSVVLSPELEAITPSFVLGMFGKSVKHIGDVDAFFRKYHFSAEPHLMAQIRRGAEYSLLKGDPLPF
ncbi:hypothetical protein ACNJYD_04350 [Bradyrhizobium sp. DASA03005]|uniref:hypothetical protein n=1 Tax=Bradyrhizobium sp. SPXBL-02 TaxID=3395912 RepID=UPI003F712C83